MHVQNLMNSLWDIRISLGLVPKESPCILCNKVVLDYKFTHTHIYIYIYTHIYIYVYILNRVSIAKAGGRWSYQRASYSKNHCSQFVRMCLFHLTTCSIKCPYNIQQAWQRTLPMRSPHSVLLMEFDTANNKWQLRWSQCFSSVRQPTINNGQSC